MSRPPRGSQSEKSSVEPPVAETGSTSAVRVARITAAGAVLATAVVPVMQHLLSDSAATAPASQPPALSTPGDGTTSPIPGQLAQVEFVAPAVGAEITPGQDVPVVGSVTGLDGNTLWILSRHDVGGSYYPVGAAGPAPVATKDGPWKVTDEGVGDPSDRGSNVVYYPVQANAECVKILSAMHNYDSLPNVPQGCTILPSLRSVRIK